MGICPCSRDIAGAEKEEHPTNTEELTSNVDTKAQSPKIVCNFSVNLRGEETIIKLSAPFATMYRILGEIRVERDVTLTSAEYLGTRQKCLVKIIPKSLSTHKVKGKTNRLETLPKLDHPHVLKTYELYQDEKCKYVIYESFEGGDVKDYLALHCVVPQQLAGVVMRQVMSALAFCHRMGIVHKTISPEHVYLKEKLKEDAVDVKLAGFENFGLVATPNEGKAFEAPEITDGREAGEKADVWSCGIILYLMLSGELPLIPQSPSPYHSPASSPRTSIKAQKSKVITFPQATWGRISKDAIGLISLMLSHKPEARPTALECLAHPWLQHYSTPLLASSPGLTSALTVLRDKLPKSAIHTAISHFILTRILKPAVLTKAGAVFTMLDRDNDGLLSRQEVIAAATECGIRGDLQRIATHVDESGMKFSDFALAAIEDSVVLSQENLLAAFTALDKDGSGQISTVELKNFFKITATQEQWKEFLSTVDTSGDGEIDFREFIMLMKSSR